MTFLRDNWIPFVIIICGSCLSYLASPEGRVLWRNTTTMAQYGESRGEAVVRIEDEMNERWGKGGMLRYEIHVRDMYGDKGATEYETYRVGSDSNAIYYFEVKLK